MTSSTPDTAVPTPADIAEALDVLIGHSNRRNRPGGLAAGTAGHLTNRWRAAGDR